MIIALSIYYVLRSLIVHNTKAWMIQTNGKSVFTMYI